MTNGPGSKRTGQLFFRVCAGWLALLVLGLPAGIAGAQTVKIGVYENAPKVFTDAAGKPAGIFIDMIEAIAGEEGWQLQYVPVTWGEGLDRLQRGDLDLMPDVAYTAERESRFAFHSEPLLSDWFQVYARKDSGIKSIVDLNGKRVAVLEQSVQQATLSRLAESFELNISLISLPDYQTIFERVAGNRADAAVTNRFYGLMHARQHDLEDTAIIFNPTRLFFAAPKEGRGGLLERIDTHLVRFKKDPHSPYHQSLRKWTSEKAAFNLPGWVKIGGTFAVIALLLSLVGGILLKRQVNVRTRELQQINSEMESRIERRTAELVIAMEKAQAADRLKSAFLATMSHELRTPLNSIIGFTGILLQKMAGPLNQEQLKQLGMVQTSARHLLALINDVLDISKIEAGQVELSLSTFEFGPSVEKVAAFVSPLAARKGLDLRLDIDPAVAAITTDQRRIEQILLNLLTNAVKFTDQGHVRISCRSESDSYHVSIADTGIGIREEHLPGLFQPFHQLDSGLSRKHEGTGLGLSICKKLIDMMGGSIDVQSRWNEGSTFTIRLPHQSGVLS